MPRLLPVLLVCLVGSAPLAQTPSEQGVPRIQRDTIDGQEVLRITGPVRIGSGGQVVVESESGSQSYRLASTLLDNGRVDEATALLEDIVAEDPTDLAAWIKLEEAYETARRFDDLVALVDRRIAREGRTVALLASRGAALWRAERPDEARRAWTEAADLAPDDAQTYRIVANEIGALRLFDEAAAVLAQGRERLGTGISPLELAHLYGLSLDYERAVVLYLEALAGDPALLGTVQARLARLIEGQGAPETFAAALQRAAALDPLDRSVRELQGWLALERGDFDGALDAVRALDRLEGERGQSLLAFAERAWAAGAPEAAAAALDEVLQRHADGPAAPAARLGRARLWDAQARDAHERAGLGPTPAADSARAGYVAFLEQNPTSDQRPRTTLALADLLRDVYRDYEASEARLREAANGRDVGIASRARLTLGEVALRRGDLDAARQRFQDVDESIRIGPLAEQARYELALIDFYEGFMYSALARAEALDENTAADAANDAIALRVTLGDALDPDVLPGPDVDLTNDPLHIYGRAALRHRRGLTEAALATLDSLDAALGAQPALADESLYLRASVLLDAGQPAEAVAALDGLIERFPTSYFVDRALRLQARTYEGELDDPASAAERYDRLLEGFPGSPLAPEARQELRRLRTVLQSS
ncbi:tetratricopeptide repeat protein [Rubrivirga marina]|uniref:Outer membrane lipoprotein BamD-like domain-containing protein n=1 Tax=Rubrivirga marina TaxID=1196024 RepID=A0A271J2E0_9BACT|nr:tetratricopeptide repeat protein [Rubrivirga marina]PAP77662.1 hypothetical protein BSZ37_15045 [Rubrivirga marina]